MTVTVPQLRPHAAAVVTVLTATLGAVTPTVPVGVGRKPDDTTSDRWAVLYPLAVEYDGPIADDAADLTYNFQITAVAATLEQCEWVADLARTALLTTDLTVTGRHCDPTSPTGGSGIQRDDDVDPPVFYRADTYETYTSPA